MDRLSEALEEMVAGTDLEATEPALVEMARGLAVAVVCDPKNAALWREFRQTVAELRQVATGGEDDDTQDFLLTIRTPVRTKVGDAQES